MSDEYYKIGYGKPPKHSQFQSGISGNPRGRPRKDTTIASLIQEMLDASIPVMVDGRKTHRRGAEALVRALYKMAYNGNIKAAEIFMKHMIENERAPAFKKHTYHDKILFDLAKSIEQPQTANASQESGDGREL